MPILVFVVIELVLFQVMLFAPSGSCTPLWRPLLQLLLPRPIWRGCSANTTHPPPISLPPMALKRSWISTGQFRARNMGIAFGLIPPCSSGAEGSVEGGGEATCRFGKNHANRDFFCVLLQMQGRDNLQICFSQKREI